jgi:glycosyltransferase involved in cell wall biosynthesis
MKPTLAQRTSALKTVTPDGPPPRLLLNLTAYDSLASGARERALGLAGALLRRGAHLILAEAAGADLASLVDVPRGMTAPRVVRTSLHPGRPVARAWRSERVFETLLREERPDAFLTDFHPVPRVRGVLTVVTVHDLRWIEAPVGRTAMRNLYFRTLYGRRLRRAGCVLTPSEFTRAEVIRCLGVKPEAVRVVQNAVGDVLRAPMDEAIAARARERLDLPRRPYHLALGVFEARKNLMLLIEAQRRLVASGFPAPPLVLAGRGGPEEAALRRAASTLPPGAVQFPGYIAPADLPAAYDGACALLHPAVYEGFGMPVVEAMARGVPVACARATALPEAAGGAALLFEADDPDDCASAMRTLSEDETMRRELVARGRERAAALTWEQAADSILTARLQPVAGTVLTDQV